MRARYGCDMLIGLTGGIGAGKSALARSLERRGARLIDADRIAHEVIETPEIRARLKTAFGADIVGEDGRLDRGRIGRRAFASTAAHQLLTEIVRPALEPELWQRAQKAGAADPTVAVIIDAPLIVEWGIHDRFDALIAVSADDEVRQTRVAERGLSKAEWGRRSSAQLPTADKVAVADYVVENNGSLAQLDAAAGRVWDALMAPRECRTPDGDDRVEETDLSR